MTAEMHEPDTAIATAPGPMDAPPPRMGAPLAVGQSWTVLPAAMSVPAMGQLAINSFVVKARDPVLVDTGLGAVGAAYAEALAATIDPADLRWIWLSHLDADHIGNLARVLAMAPNAQIVTNFLGMGKMMLAGLDVSRVRVLDRGEVLDLGDRSLIPVRPPYYDAPETMGFVDTAERALFAGDAFGALLAEVPTRAEEIDDAALAQGMVGWSAVDAPWLATADRDRFAGALSAVDRIDPAFVLSGHLPPATGPARRLTAIMRQAWCEAPDSGPAGAPDPLAIDQAVAAVEAAFRGAPVPVD